MGSLAKNGHLFFCMKLNLYYKKLHNSWQRVNFTQGCLRFHQKSWHLKRLDCVFPWVDSRECPWLASFLCGRPEDWAAADMGCQEGILFRRQHMPNNLPLEVNVFWKLKLIKNSTAGFQLVNMVRWFWLFQLFIPPKRKKKLSFPL